MTILPYLDRLQQGIKLKLSHQGEFEKKDLTFFFFYYRAKPFDSERTRKPTRLSVKKTNENKKIIYSVFRVSKRTEYICASLK